jgi:hypothetical protein
LSMSKSSANGEEKEHVGVRWISHCGVWWSERVWKHVDAQHRRMTPEGRCGECSRVIFTVEQREKTIAQERAGAFDRKLRDVQCGLWLQFYGSDQKESGEELIVPPGVSVQVATRACEPYVATHLGFSADALGKLSVENLRTCRTPLVVGPVCADYFAVRIPDDVAQPIDRGAALPELVVLLPTVQAIMEVRNVSREPWPLRAALFVRVLPNDFWGSGKPRDLDEYVRELDSR